MMNAVRAPAVAGCFYPGSAAGLATMVAGLLDASAPRDAAVPKAIVVPHAGYVYSGGVAAAAYARVAPGRGRIRRVVLVGPAHRVAVRCLAVPRAGVFATPLGDVAVDTEAVASLAGLPQVVASDTAHAAEHALEVQLPFLQTVLGDFRVVPIVVGAASAADVAVVLELLWGGPETLVVISSDLSHYHCYADAQALDRGTVERMMACAATLGPDQACGATAVNGLLICARQHGLVPELLALANSGDTAGDRTRVVGYAALAWIETPAAATMPS
jgi:AmmeMemoRadiSam system protein B